MKSFVVIGIGRFGSSLAKTLANLGHDVLAIDEDEDAIHEISTFVTHAVCADATDEQVLKSLGVRNFDVAVVAVGGEMGVSTLVTLLLRDMGIKYVVAKAQSNLHAKVLQKVGADKIIFPEHDIGVRLAHSLARANILDYIELSPDYSIMELAVPNAWIGKNLASLNIRAKFGMNIMAIKRGTNIDISPDAKETLQAEDILVALGSNEVMGQF